MADAKLMHLVGSSLMWDALPGSESNRVLNANNDVLSFIFQAPEAITITRLGFRYGVRAGTPPTYRISLQTVANTGLASGTILGATANALATFTPPASTAWDGTWQWQTLAESAIVARGDWLAIVIDYSSGTIDGSNNSSFTYAAGTIVYSIPYSTWVDGGAAAVRSGQPVYGYASATKTYGWPHQSRASTTAVGDGTTPDEVGLRWTFDSGYGDTYQVLGVVAQMRWAASTDVTMTLYSGTTALQAITIDSDTITAAASYGAATLYFDEATLSSLSYGSEYTIAFKTSHATDGFRIYQLQQAAAGDWDGYPNGQSSLYAYRTDSGAWSTDATKRPLMGLILAGITEPAGGGGGPLIGGRLVQ